MMTARRPTIAGQVEPRDLNAALILALGIVVVAAAMATWWPIRATASFAPTDRIDPNTAPWHELTALPDIGEGAARAIVEHRRRVRHERGDGNFVVFHTAADLDAVRGVGPVTIARIAPYLRFEGPPTRPPD